MFVGDVELHLQFSKGFGSPWVGVEQFLETIVALSRPRKICVGGVFSYWGESSYFVEICSSKECVVLSGSISLLS